MDETQTDHLRSYGIAYIVLDKFKMDIQWVLNYRGGSFIIPLHEKIQTQCNIFGVKYEIISESDLVEIKKLIEKNNMDIVVLEKAPKIAVYTPLTSYDPDNPELLEPWDDAVILVLEYAQIPYDKLYDRDVLGDKLLEYDWLHLHHEDFTGQFGKFYAHYRNALWYKSWVLFLNKLAGKLGYNSIHSLKNSVALKIKEYVLSGGFLFAMCSACDTLDVSLATVGVDIVPAEIDGTPMDPGYEDKMDYSRCFAFTNFELERSAYVYEFSDIDISNYQNPKESHLEDFILFEFSAKQDPVPTILTQDHQKVIMGFFGQTSTFNLKTIKDNVIIMAYTVQGDRAKYLYCNHGKGFFSFFAGHDPEDYSHKIGDPPTDVSQYKNSPGYRLILNNILFPAARKKKRKT